MLINAKRHHILIIASYLSASFFLLPGCSCNKSSTGADVLNPKISVTYNSTEIQSGQTLELTSYSGNPADIIFTIGNKGAADLILREYSLSSNAFIISKEPAALLSPNERTEFTIRLSSKEKNNFTDVRINSNDPDKADLTFGINCRKSNIEIFFAGPSYDLSLEEALIEKINNQAIDEYLDICIYGLDSEAVIGAIENAIARDVRVRFVGDLDGGETVEKGTGNYYTGYYRIAAAMDAHSSVAGKKRANFPLDKGFDDFNLINSSIMHNKFALFSDDSGNKYIFTGSANCTDSDFKLNNNNSIIIQDPGIAGTFREQFEYLLGLPGKAPVSGIRNHVVDGIPIDVLFAPVIAGETPMSRLMNITDSADRTIHFMIFSFTHLDLLNQLLNKQKNSVEVKGIFDESQLSSSSEELLVQNGIPCRIDGNYFEEKDGSGGKLHHKTMILDDAVVITGSYNWSYTADTKNDENIVVFYSGEIAKLYKDEWQKRWDEGKDIINNNNNEEYAYQDVLINEVMWMGSRKEYSEAVPNDEFIELKNMRDQAINLNGWSIEGAGTAGKILYLGNSFIMPYGYMLIMHKEKSASAFQAENCIVTSGLSISNDSIQIILKDPKGNIIDYAGNGSAGKDFAGYNEILKKSMARMDSPGDGKDLNNWFTTNTQANISSGYSYSLFNLATPGTLNSNGDSGHSVLCAVISEVAWAGTDLSYTDEWLELYNNTDADINLTGWQVDGSLKIDLYGIIPARKHFLLERTDDNTVPGKSADMTYTGSLNNTGGIIRLMYNNREIDFVDMLSGWAAGSDSPKISMERIDMNASGESTNWRDGLGDIEGAESSADF